MSQVRGRIPFYRGHGGRSGHPLAAVLLVPVHSTESGTPSWRKSFVSFTPHHLYFDDVEIGQEWDSPRRTVTESDIVNFAGLSGDFNPIHVDHEFAKNTAF